MWFLLACGPPAPLAPDPSTVATPPGTQLADVVSVRVGGSEGAYEFDVGVRSPDLDCTRYANWWEVIRPDGSLVYRRVLNHSHADEQPFIRDGGPIAVSASEQLIVRAHLHPNGYGGAALVGSALAGFTPDTVALGFAASLARSEPQPTECWF